MTVKYMGIDRRYIAIGIIALVLFFNVGGSWTYLSSRFATTPGSSTTATVTNTVNPQVLQSGCASTVASQPQAVSSLAAHYASDAAISNGLWSRYLPTTAGGPLTLSPYTPGAFTDGTVIAAAGSFAIGTPNTGSIAQGPTWESIGQSSGYNAYPMWVNPAASNLGGTQFINLYDTFTVICQPSASNAAANIWAMSAQLVESPTSGATAYTYAAGYINFNAATPTAMPTAASTWNFQLILNNTADTYKDAMLPYAECGTVTSPVTNYATGAVYNNCPSGPGQGGLPTVQGYMILFMNQTQVSVGLGNGAPAGMTLTKVNSGLATGTSAWIVAVPAGPPAPGTGVSASNAYIAANVPISLYSTQSTTSKHIQLIAWFVDMQQGVYLSGYLADAATVTSGVWMGKPSQSSAGVNAYNVMTAIAGTPTSAGGLTPTSSNNAGNPSPLINQYVTIVLTY